MDLTHNDVKYLIELVDGAEHLDEVEVEFGGFRLHIRRSNSGPHTPQVEGQVKSQVEPQSRSPESQTEPLPPPSATKEIALAENEIAIRAPMLGTFYRAPAPGEKPFVEVGQRVRAQDTLCIIEVMKLLNSISAGYDGVVKSILVENGQFVEFGQMLVVVARSI